MCVVHMIIWCIFTINSYVRSFGWTHCVIIEIYKDTCWRVLGPSTRFLWWTLKRFLCCVQWLSGELLSGLAFGLMFGGTSGAVLVIWLTPMMMVIPIDYGAFVIGLQVRTSLWFIVTVAMSGIMVNVLAFQFCGVISRPETMRNMCAPYVFNFQWSVYSVAFSRPFPGLFSVGLMLGSEFCDAISS